MFNVENDIGADYNLNLDILMKNINEKKYESILAFHADAKWLLFNCSVFILRNLNLYQKQNCC